MQQEQCYLSLAVLKHKIQQQGPSPLRSGSFWLPDFEGLGKQASHTQDIVLTGRFLQRLLESGNWLPPSLRLWCLSSVVKRTLIKTFDFRPSQIGVIDRYQLFPVKKQKKFDRDELNLVYGGRICTAKNVLLLLHVTYHLQNFLSCPVQLFFIGPFDEEKHEHRDKSEKNLNSFLKEIFEKLKFKDQPVFMSKRSAQSWFDLPIENPVFFSLSTYLFEDFGVALAQAQSAGWPAIISDWGGHRDVKGENILKIPAHLLSDTNRWEDREEAGYSIAQFIAHHFEKKGKEKEKDPLSFIEEMPEDILIDEIDKHRRCFVRKYVRQVDLLAGKDILELVAEGSGAKLLYDWRREFGLEKNKNLIEGFLISPGSIANQKQKKSGKNLRYISLSCLGSGYNRQVIKSLQKYTLGFNPSPKQIQLMKMMGVES